MSFWRRIFGGSGLPDSFDAPREAPPPSDPTDFCKLIAREGAWLVAREIKGTNITFIDYIDGSGQHVWPLFSTQDTAAVWASESGVTEVTTFPCLKLTPEAILEVMPKGARIVFDEKSPYERVLSPQDLAFLESLVGKAGPSAE